MESLFRKPRCIVLLFVYVFLRSYTQASACLLHTDVTPALAVIIAYSILIHVAYMFSLLAHL